MLTAYYGYGLGSYWDPTYILIIIGVIITGIASVHLRTTFNKYSKIRGMSGMTGAQVAERILYNAGIYDVSIVRVSGNLTDNYNPKNKTLSLSDSVYDSNSVAAVGVAAHECGHAIQHQIGYAPLNFRSLLVPVAQFGSGASWFLILLGIFMSAQPLLTLGIIAFSCAVLFQIVTLPVEFNASSRALKALENNHILYDEELRGTKEVLSAAALTYVAGVAASVLQLIRLVILFGGRNDD